MSKLQSTWQSVGAWQGGTVSALALSPNFINDGLMLAATARGFIARWMAVKPGRFVERACTIPVLWLLRLPRYNPIRQDALLPRPAVAAFLLASDGGQTWTEVLNWAGLGVITAFAISPAFADDQTLFVATGEGVFRSQDGGEDWESSTLWPARS